MAQRAGLAVHLPLADDEAELLQLAPGPDVGLVVLLSTAFGRSDELGDRIWAFQRGEALEPFDLPPTIQLPPEKLGEFEQGASQLAVATGGAVAAL